MPIGASIWGPILAGAVGPAIGGLMNNNAQGGRTREMNDLIGRLRHQNDIGNSAAFGNGDGTGGIFPQLQDLMLQNLTRSNQAIFGNEQDPNGAFGNLQNSISKTYDPQGLLQTLMGGQFDPYGQNIPGVQGALGQMGGLTGAQGGQNDLARQMFANGGQNDNSDRSFNNLTNFMSGQSVPQQGMTNMANNLFSQNGNINPLFQSIMNSSAKGLSGANPWLDYAQNSLGNISKNQGQTGPTNQGIGAASGMFGNGGMTPGLSGLESQGFNAFGNNGLTPTGVQGENAALQVLNNAGQTPTTQGLQNRGLDLAGRESLLPMNQVASMARDEAATAYQNNMEGARRQAFARGGGPGATVANGLQNSAMSDYADKGAQAESQAVRDALVKQQGLQLQQAGMGANMAEQGGSLQNNRFGTAANTLTGLEGVAANRFGLGGNFIQGANNAATNRAGTGLSSLNQLAGLQSGRELGSLNQIGGNEQTRTNQQTGLGGLGLGANAQSLQGLGLGSGMYNDTMQGMLTGNGQYNNLIGTTGQLGLGAGQLANSGTQGLNSILESILGGNLSSSTQGLNRTNSFLGANQQGINSQQGLLNFLAQMQSGNQASGSGMLGQLLNLSQGGLQGLTQLYQPKDNTATNPFAGLVSSVIGGGLGQIKFPGSGGGGGIGSLPAPTGNPTGATD